MSQHEVPMSAQEIQEWIVDFLATEYGLQQSEIDLDCPFTDLGLDSLETVMLLSLENAVGLELTPSVVFDHPTIRHLAEFAAQTASGMAQAPVDASHGTDPTASDYERYVNPFVGHMLRVLSLDKEFVSAEGSWLYDENGRAYLDCVASYGAVPFGHGDRGIWDAVREVGERGEPVFVQPSRLGAAAELAKRLADLVFDAEGFVTFANSGAEAVEAAIKLSRASTGRPGILSTEGGFHGKTYGALSATGSSVHKSPFGPLAQDFEQVPFGDGLALERALRERPDFYAAFFVEPIQGEGGIVEAPVGYLRRVRELCSQYGVLMVCDEVQTGLGRTGRMFAVEEEGATPDVLTLAKALGGGVVPIGACVAHGALRSAAFGYAHSSTFAGGALAARVGLAVLDRLEMDNRGLLRAVHDKGELLRAALEEIRAMYPEVISEVRGRGFMLGIRLGIDLELWSSSLLAIAGEAGCLCALVSSYLLNAHAVRVAPTLTASDVLRIEPPLTITRNECDRLIAALKQTVSVLAHGDAGALLRGIIHGRPHDPWNRTPRRSPALLLKKEEPCFAFISHPLDLESYGKLDPSLQELSDEEKRRAREVLKAINEPLIVKRLRVESPAGKSAVGLLISINHTAAELVGLPREEREAQIRAAIRLARDAGASRVGLGAYTSVVTAGGSTVLDEGVSITSGNSYTCVAAVDAIQLACRLQAIDMRHATVAVVGGGGAIGRALSLLLAERVARLVLVGNPASGGRSERRLRRVGAEALQHLAGRLEHHQGGGELFHDVSLAPGFPASPAPLSQFERFLAEAPKDFPLQTTLSASPPIREADIVVTATSAPELSFGHEAFGHGAVVCDVSRPRNVGPEVAKARPDLLIIEGGSVAVPGELDVGLGLPTGRAYACMAETMMLALDECEGHVSIGRNLDLRTILHMRASAERHGFGVRDVLT